MQNTQIIPNLDKKVISRNQFDDAEYKRWSENLRSLKSAEADWGIEAFFGQTEKPQEIQEITATNGKLKKESSRLTFVEVAKEMNRPRFVESARKEENANRHTKVRSPKNLKV
jgi:hypothetical protein